MADNSDLQAEARRLDALRATKVYKNYYETWKIQIQSLQEIASEYLRPPRKRDDA